MNRLSFLKYLLAPLLAPLLKLLPKRELLEVQHNPVPWDKFGDRSYRMWIDDEGSVKIAWVSGKTETVLHDLPREWGWINVSLDSVEDPIATWTPIK